jgi:hypothetical protein
MKNINSIESKFIILSKNAPKFNNSNCVGIAKNIEDFTELIKENNITVNGW